MSEDHRETAAPGTDLSALVSSLEAAVERLEETRLAKAREIPRVLELCRRLLAEPDGIAPLYQIIPRLARAGIFAGTDWAWPEILLAGLVSQTFDHGDRQTVIIECLSELRMLAIANGDHSNPGLSSEQARHFLTQVLALNLNRLFDGGDSEAARLREADLNAAISHVLRYLLDHVGFEDILGSLIDEIWRITNQRPIQMNHVKTMITQIAVTLNSGTSTLGETRLGADRLISALFGPTQGCNDDPGLDAYRERLGAMDETGRQQEASGFARAMHDTGLVSDYHAEFLRWLVQEDLTDLIPHALGLSTTGLDALRTYKDLVHRLIEEAVYPATGQTVYALAQLLERGILYMPSIAPSLWRHIGLRLSAQTAHTMSLVFGEAHAPRVYLLAGVIQVLGQPLGVGQGNNPTCQSARAISMWSFAQPDYLLHLIAQAARFDNIMMHFEGVPIESSQLPLGLARSIPLDNDPVSTLLVPHLDRIYGEMGRRCIGRAEDPHLWINPEFHGWWVGRLFAIAVDVNTGHLKDFDQFIRHFLASYHPFYNGNQPVLHPQPAGLAVTDSAGDFVGWHAITLLRVGLDQTDTMRAYFYNPNNDSGQNWGHGVTVSTQGHGERYGESSLPIEQLASRLYIFHDDPLAEPALAGVPEEEVAPIRDMALASWASDRLPAAAQDSLSG
jgi:hypothetical protein